VLLDGLRGLWRDLQPQTRLSNGVGDRLQCVGRRSKSAAESSHHEGRIKPIWSRFVASGEDSKETAARALLLWAGVGPALALTFGPALALSYGTYRATTEKALRRGSVPVRRPWLVAAAVLAVAGIAAAALLPDLATVATLRYYPEQTVAVHWGRVGLMYLWWQTSVGLALVAWQVRRHGWPGVTVADQAQVPTVPSIPQVPTVPAAAHEPSPVPALPPVPDTPRAPAIEDAPFVVVSDDEDDEPPYDEDALFALIYGDEDVPETDTTHHIHQGGAA